MNKGMFLKITRKDLSLFLVVGLPLYTHTAQQPKEMGMTVLVQQRGNWA